MYRAIKHFILTIICLAAATAAAAQGRVPSAESAAIGGDIGIVAPRDEALATGLSLEGFYEYYFTPRASLRLGLGWANLPFEREDDDSLRTLRVPIDLVYNWEHGDVHPFVGAGVGIYFLQQKDNGESIGDSETKLGVTFSGGAEFFTGPALSIKGEARYHVVNDVFGVNPGGLAVTIGVKTYF
ncbi:MAG TPA: outer membrane beta-barrel protein [Vicinamibacterales bacterium]|nr:outer membrane beta-barrel protein [Vicinamibacterales bacterium]